MTLGQIYSQVPSFLCKAGCHDCCGPTVWAKDEYTNITSWLKKHNRKELMATGIDCPYLNDKGCSIYKVRPILCRLFGSVDNPIMLCPHGRRPAKLITDKKAERLLKELWNTPSKTPHFNAGENVI